jgi:hypothetical protein
MEGEHQMTEQELKDQYPKLFDQSKTNLIISNYGIQCDEGWFPIIATLCEQLNGLAEELKLTDDSWPYFLQIKEKFGTLRTYINFSGFKDEVSQDKVRNIIEQASLSSAITCERCGQPGSFRNTGWVHTYCDPCQADYLERFENAE